MKKLIGFKRFTSRKGAPTCIAVLASQYTPQQNERGSYGCDVEQVFLPQEQFDYLTVEDLGKEVITDYDIIGSRAYLRNLVVNRDEKKK